MKKLRLFLIALAFLSILSTSAFAQWGSIITVSSDTEYLDAMQNTSVEKILFTEGYYASIGREMQNTDMLIKKQQKSGLPPDQLPCVYGTLQILPQCWNEFVGDHIDLLASANVTCSAIGWQLTGAMSAEIGGVVVASPTIVQGLPYTVGAISYYPAAPFLKRTYFRT